MKVAEIRKLVAVLVGLSVLFLFRRYGVDLTGTEHLWTDLFMLGGEAALSGLTAFAVWYWPNEKAEP